MSVFDALDDYQRQLTTDCDSDTNVIFVVEARGFAAPRVRALGRDGRVWQFERLQSKADPDGTARLTSPWTIDDLDDAISYLVQLRREIRYRGWEGAADRAAANRQTTADRRDQAVMERAAWEAERPHVCPCGERWKTNRGMKQHQRACWMIDPLTGEARPDPHGKSGSNHG